MQRIKEENAEYQKNKKQQILRRNQEIKEFKENLKTTSKKKKDKEPDFIETIVYHANKDSEGGG